MSGYTMFRVTAEGNTSGVSIKLNGSGSGYSNKVGFIDLAGTTGQVATPSTAEITLPAYLGSVSYLFYDVRIDVGASNKRVFGNGYVQNASDSATMMVNSNWAFLGNLTSLEVTGSGEINIYGRRSVNL